jgi:hypothetical protein
VRSKEIRTGTGSHLSAFAPEPARSLLFPLLSHSVIENRQYEKKEIDETTKADGDVRDDMMSELKETGRHPVGGYSAFSCTVFSHTFSPRS